jgi:Tfp pilus assembly pilus retraction ATPase PilT
MVAFLSKESYLNNLLLELKEKNVSDIHIKSGHKIYCRINGDIVILEDSKILSSDDIINNLQVVLTIE